MHYKSFVQLKKRRRLSCLQGVLSLWTQGREESTVTAALACTPLEDMELGCGPVEFPRIELTPTSTPTWGSSGFTFSSFSQGCGEEQRGPLNFFACRSVSSCFLFFFLIIGLTVGFAVTFRRGGGVRGTIRATSGVYGPGVWMAPASSSPLPRGFLLRARRLGDSDP